MKTKLQYEHMKEHGLTMNIKEAKIALLQGVAIYHPMFEQCNPKIGCYVSVHPQDDSWLYYDSCLGVEKIEDFFKSLWEEDWQTGWTFWGISSNFIYSEGPKRFSIVVDSYKRHNIAFRNATTEQVFMGVYCHLKSLLVGKKQLQPCTDYLEEYMTQ